MDEVWDALCASNELVMIRDLRSINDMKNLMSAIEEFRKIMMKDKNLDSTSVDKNPLIKG